MVSAPRIARQRLAVEEVPGHPGRRLVRVDYDFAVDPRDSIVGHRADERVVIRGIELGGDPIAAAEEPIATLTASFIVAAGDQTRGVEQLVHRVFLDVEQDWWSTGNGGETIPIAEWADHLVALIQIEVDDAAITEALTPVLTGSWGALGES